MAKSKKSEVTCDIKEVLGYINKKQNKVLVKVSWNGGPYRTEVRMCWLDDAGGLHLGKGIALEDDEIDELIRLLKKRPRPVDFNAIFASSEGIMDKRRAGFRTEDGFIKLTPRRPDIFAQ